MTRSQRPTHSISEEISHSLLFKLSGSGFRVQGSGFRVQRVQKVQRVQRVQVAASPQRINRAMPEGGIQVTSHRSLVTPNPQSLIPSYSSLLSNFRVQGSGLASGAARPLIE